MNRNICRKERNCRRQPSSNRRPIWFIICRMKERDCSVTEKGLAGRRPELNVRREQKWRNYAIVIDAVEDESSSREVIDRLQCALERERAARVYLEQQLNQLKESYAQTQTLSPSTNNNSVSRSKRTRNEVQWKLLGIWESTRGLGDSPDSAHPDLRGCERSFARGRHPVLPSTSSARRLCSRIGVVVSSFLCVHFVSSLP